MDSSSSSAKKDEMPSSSPTSPTKLTTTITDDSKNSLPTSPIPFSPSPPPSLRVSPPPSYTSGGSFRRCDNKMPSACIYCGNAGGKNSPSSKYGWEPKAQAQYFLERSQQALRAMTFLGLALFFIVIFILLVYGNQHFFQPKTFSGWCGTSFVDEGQPRHFAQEMEINPNELYEKIQVPKFGLNRPAVFVHDFRKNITAIVDVLGDRCFLKTLDRSIVAPPKNFIDLIQKMETGYYSQNPRVIHETFRVGGQLTSTDISDLDSTMVSRHCNGKDVYQLVKASRTIDAPYFVRDKRDASHQNEDLQFSVLNGDNVEIERIIF